MKLNKNSLRKLILQEMRLLKESKELPSLGDIAAAIENMAKSKGLSFISGKQSICSS